MPTGDFETAIPLSLLDRLIDLEPEVRKEVPLNSWEQMRQFRDGLSRDLTDLLNTRRAERDFDPVHEEASNSVLRYGISDFTSYDCKSQTDRERIRLSMERAIRQFEPRLAQAEVSVDEPDPLRPALQFQISALLWAGASAEPVVFDATLQRDSRRISVSKGR